jgi:hypothetical protein
MRCIIARDRSIVARLRRDHARSRSQNAPKSALDDWLEPVDAAIGHQREEEMDVRR